MSDEIDSPAAETTDTIVVDATVPVPPPRPLEAINADVVAAKARHDAALTEMKNATGFLGTVVAEYRAAVTWADEECKKVEAEAGGILASAEVWLKCVL